MRYQIPLVALIAVITVATIATLGVISISATNMSPQSANTEKIGMYLGHVEMIVRGSDGEIKNYFQSDNIVTDTGDRCASERLFPAGLGTNSGNGEQCSGAGIEFIGLLNGTAITSIDVDRFSDYGAANAGDPDGDIMAIVGATTVTIESVATAGPIDTTLDNAAHLFNFDVNNATTIEGVFLADALCNTENANGECTTPGTATEIFAQRDATLDVSSGDTLQVTWTISIGASGS